MKLYFKTSSLKRGLSMTLFLARICFEPGQPHSQDCKGKQKFAFLFLSFKLRNATSYIPGLGCVCGWGGCRVNIWAMTVFCLCIYFFSLLHETRMPLRLGRKVTSQKDQDLAKCLKAFWQTLGISYFVCQWVSSFGVCSVLGVLWLQRWICVSLCQVWLSVQCCVVAYVRVGHWAPCRKACRAGQA